MAAGAPSGNQQYGGHLGEEAKAYFTGGSRGSGDYNNGGGRGEGSGGYGGGHGFACGRGAGRGGQGLINFGPGEYKPIVQRKAESPCSYCGRGGREREWTSTDRGVGKRTTVVEEGTLLSAGKDRPHDEECPDRNEKKEQNEAAHEVRAEDSDATTKLTTTTCATESPSKGKSGGVNNAAGDSKGKRGGVQSGDGEQK
ncbi:hypothetical protein PF005_g1303 [Phytophthora fragariae]|uniref:Uncharacterized protein n=1 Tax=Phytophthora fragariae TaxID=53985 RepID=A0A6A3ZIX3_9STRA|nr:hypothetical protein PF005_g1303 [Phytophthora fragariae]